MFPVDRVQFVMSCIWFNQFFMVKRLPLTRFLLPSSRSPLPLFRFNCSFFLPNFFLSIVTPLHSMLPVVCRSASLSTALWIHWLYIRPLFSRGSKAGFLQPASSPLIFDVSRPARPYFSPLLWNIVPSLHLLSLILTPPSP